MGKTAAAKLRRARGVKFSNTNYKLRITNFARRRFKFVVSVCALCVFTAGNFFAQTNLDSLAEKIARGSVEEKRDALFQIRNLETVEAARRAVPALKDKSEVVRATAAFAVLSLPKDESLANLLALLKDKKELVRREAARALGKTANPNALNFLIQTFRADKIPDVRNASIVAVGEIGDVAAIEFLTEILRRKPKESEEFQRRAAARSIGQIAQIIQTGKREVLTPEDFLPERYKQIEKPKYLLLETFPTFRSAQTALIEVLQNARETDDARRESAFALGAIGDRAATAVLQANLDAKDYYLAQICREALRRIAVYSS